MVGSLLGRAGLTDARYLERVKNTGQIQNNGVVHSNNKGGIVRKDHLTSCDIYCIWMLASLDK